MSKTRRSEIHRSVFTSTLKAYIVSTSTEQCLRELVSVPAHGMEERGARRGSLRHCATQSVGRGRGRAGQGRPSIMSPSTASWWLTPPWRGKRFRLSHNLATTQRWTGPGRAGPSRIPQDRHLSRPPGRTPLTPVGTADGVGDTTTIITARRLPLGLNLGLGLTWA